MEHELAYFTRPDGVRIAYGTAGDGPPLVIAPGPAVAPVEVQKSLVSLVRASWGMGSKVFADMPIPEATTEMQEDLARIAPPTPARSFRTIVFTDVEGSTHLSMRLGDEAARDVLRRHETITRKVLATHGGTEIKAMGDGFMISFDSASSALDAATAMQRSIAARDDAPFRVRIGIDAGEPIEETTICLVPP